MVIDTTIVQSRERWPTNGERRPLIIGLAGGSGSGKSTIADAVVTAVGPDSVSLVRHDAYYRGLSHLSQTERAAVNFDHSDSLETELLVAHLEALRAGNAIERPIYELRAPYPSARDGQN
jgi:uridine kinase